MWPPPVWLMRQAGRYLPEYRALRERAGSFWTLCMKPPLAAEATLQPLVRFDLDAAIVFSDILVVPHAMGREVVFDEREGPRVAVATSAGELADDDRAWAAAMAPVYETIALVRGRLDPAKTLLGFAGAPWTLATYLAEGKGSPDQRAARLWAYRDPEGFTAFLDRIGDGVAFHLVEQLKAGADAVQIFDSWAGGLAPELFSRCVIAPTCRVVKKVRAKIPQALIIGFPRGATLEGYARYAAETGVDAVSLDTGVDMEVAAGRLAPLCALQGNLDPLALVAGGAAQARATDRILAAMRGQRFIFNLGHGVLPETPPEHVGELVAQVRGAR